jgi:tetratricopeptide (TPR) repeat protein
LAGRLEDEVAAATMRPVYDEALVRLHDMARSGDNLAQHALALAPGAVAAASAPLARLDWQGRDAGRLPVLLYAMAQKLIADANDQDAAALLGAALALGAARSEIAAGLAVCAARMERYAVAVTLAELCLGDNDQHPRMLFIAGFCELKRGNRRTAKVYLARAARLARSRPEFRADQRTAQRLLLVLQFAQ